VAGDGRLGAEARRPTSVVGDGVGIDASGPVQAQSRARGGATWRAASGGGGVTQRRPRHRRKRRRAEVGWGGAKRWRWEDVEATPCGGGEGALLGQKLKWGAGALWAWWGGNRCWYEILAFIGSHHTFIG
jgi:hypothetical protein